MRKYNQGFTLIEALISLAIFSIVIAGVFLGITIGRNSWASGLTSTEVQAELRRGMSAMVKEIRQSRSNIVTLNADGLYYNTIIFKIPQDTDSDGDVVDAAGAVEWSGNIQYSKGGLNNQQLLKAQGGNTTVLANRVSQIQFMRTGSETDVINIILTVQKSDIPGHAYSASLTSQVKLRN